MQGAVAHAAGPGKLGAMRRAWMAGMAFTVAVGVFFVGPRPARACSCLPPSANMVHDGDAAFVGVLTARSEVDPPDPEGPISTGRPVLNHFTVERVLKGDLGPTVEVEAPADGASCGLEAPVGARTGLVLQRQGDRWTSSLCSTLPLDMTASLPGRPPGPADGMDLADVAAAAALSLAAIGVAVAGDRRRLTP